MEVAARGAAAPLLPFALRKTAVSAIAVRVAVAGPLPARRGGLARARLAGGAGAVHVLPDGAEAVPEAVIT